MNCLMIAASHRTVSLNRGLVQAAQPLLEAESFTVDAPDYGTLDLPIFNDQMREDGQFPSRCLEIKEQFARADALVIASPEYNWSYPGSLKNLLDWMSAFSPCPLNGKPALLMSATPSRRGGVVGIAHLKVVLESLGMYVYPSSFLLGDATPTLPTEQIERLARVIHDFSAYARALHKLR